MWTQPRGPRGESIQEHQENTGLILVVLVVFVLMWGPCSMLGYVAAVGGLPAMLVAFVASSLCTILSYSNCAISPNLCFYLSRHFQAGLRDLFRRPVAARHTAGVAGASSPSRKGPQEACGVWRGSEKIG
ncbi:hypothetical protein GH733_000278 [Mirounga leonina]|nr:hypothetical protein GH733_000278 [Mirounga leonina]